MWSVNEMKSARKLSRLKAKLRDLRELFIDCFSGIILLMGFVGAVIIGSVAVASLANALRMSGYLDVVFGMHVLITVYVLVWVPVAALVYYYKEE